MLVAGVTCKVRAGTAMVTATDDDGMPLATTTKVLAPSSIPAGSVKLVDEAALGAIDREL